MKILVISDTHITDPKKSISKELNEEIETSDYCFHAGDFVIYPIYLNLRKKITTFAVAGNMDDEKIVKNLPQKKIIELGGFNFALTHGKGASGALEHYMSYQFKNDYGKIDVFVFGHFHQVINREINNKIYFNPGSVGDTITSSERTYGIIEINDKKIKRSVKKIG